eukprot:2888871-Ditylum_brightwellii.AAC.1
MVADETYSNLQLQFTHANRELHQLQTTAQQVEYSVNIAEIEEQDDKVCHRIAEALANLTKATTTDKAAVANLLELSTELATQLVNMIKKIKENDIQMNNIRKSIDNLTAALRELRHTPDASARVGTPVAGRKYYC